MTQQRSTERAAPTEVLELLRTRAVLEDWLRRLDGQRGNVSPRVYDRVRADYEARLHRTLDELTDRRLAVEDELDRAEERLAATQQKLAEAREGLEEARLRHSIGEIDDRAWSERSRELEEATRGAAEEERLAREEVEKLRQLVAQLDERTAEAPTAPTNPAPERAEPVPPGPVTDADPTSSGFLEQVDRAIVGSDGTEVLGQGNGHATMADPETAPKPGLKCGECGYTNDLSAWFCGVCGADLA